MPALLPSLLAIAIGASAGAVLRWLLALWLNALWPALPPGTLLANLIGGYLIGLAMSVFSHIPSLPVEWRLMIVTGFLGGLTTFSTFSVEVVTLLQNEKYAWGMAAIALHVGGSLIATFLGIATFAILRAN